MKKLNNKGFTLVEVLAVIVILTVIGLIAIPSVIDAINTSKDASYNMLVKDITIAAKQLFEEIEYVGNTNLYNYKTTGIDSLNPNITLDTTNSQIAVNLQTLVSNGFLKGSNNPDKSGTNKNDKIITNPKTKADIGICLIKIEKTVSGDSVSYEMTYPYSETDPEYDADCPITDDYAKALGI